MNNLLIKEISKTELLFWKIFRNVVLNHEIFKYMDLHLKYPTNYFKYQDIIHMDWLINNNQKLLIDKLKRGETLTISYTVPTSYTPSSQFSSPDKFPFFECVFKEFKNCQTIEFYKMLFSNHKKYIQLIDMELQIVKPAILNGSLSALDVLISDYGYRPTISIFKYAISKLILKSLRYLISNGNGIKKLDQKDLKSIFYPITCVQNRKVYKIINCLIENQLLQLNNSESSSPLAPWLIELIFQTRNPNYDKTIYRQFKLIDLFNACYLIISTSPTATISIEQLNQVINDFKLFLKYKLKSVIIQLCSPIILQLVQLLFQTKKDINNQFLLSLVYENENLEIKATQTFITSTTHYIQALKFGDFKFFLKYSNIIDKSKMYQLFIDFYERKENPNILFKHCRNDRDKQIKFIMEITKFILENGTNSSTNKVMDGLFLLYLVIDLDDLQLVKLVLDQFSVNDYQVLKVGISAFNELVQQNNFSSNIPILSIQRFIKSIEMLELCWSSFDHDLKNKSFFQFKEWSSILFYGFLSTSLLSRFIQLIGKDLPKQQETYTIEKYMYPFYIKDSNINTTKELLKMMVYTLGENTQPFSNCFLDSIFIPKSCTSESDFKEIFNNLVIIFNHEKYTFKVKQPFLLFENKYQQLLLTEWLIRNRGIENVGNTNMANSFNNSHFYDKRYVYPLYSIGEFDYCQHIGTDKKLTELYIQYHVNIGHYGDIINFDKVLSTIINQNESTKSLMVKDINDCGYSFAFELMVILQNAAVNGRLNLFNHLFNNYNFIFKYQQSQSWFISTQDFTKLTRLAKDNGQYDIIDFFYQNFQFNLNNL